MTDHEPVLDVRDLSVEYHATSGVVKTVGDVSLTVHPGTIYGIVGESGSGKSTLALSAVGFTSGALRRTTGTSRLGDTDLFELPSKRLRVAWGHDIGYVPQEIGGALHPSFRIGAQFRESLRINRGMGKAESDARAISLLAAAGIPEPARALRRYPHQFSGGQLQRIAIALALAPHPRLLVLDEPTTGLDVTTQQRVTAVLRELVTSQGVAALFISHDIALLSECADQLVVMYAGEVIESGPVRSVLRRPRHPYTRALVDAVPSVSELTVPVGIPGLPPGHVVEGRCGFADRCLYALPTCVEAKPPLEDLAPGHGVRCIRAHELDLVPVSGGERGTTVEQGDPVLEVEALRCVFRAATGSVVAVDGVSFAVHPGRVTAIVGESGSGKSTLGHAIAGALRPTEGRIRLDGRDLPANPSRRTKADRKAIQLIFQSTAGALNPRRKVGTHLRTIAARYLPGSEIDRKRAIDEVLAAVQFSTAMLERYPRELSGGQKQRVAIAAAFLACPRVVICDEITSGQDVSVQAAILETLRDLQQTSGTSVVLISHDLGVVRSMSDDVVVMQAGRVVEAGPTERVFTAPREEYTRSLLAAIPRVETAP